MTLSEIVTQNIKKLRESKKLTQEKFAKKCAFSVSYISMLERGQRLPTLETIERLARAFGVKPLDMLRA